MQANQIEFHSSLTHSSQSHICGICGDYGDFVRCNNCRGWFCYGTDEQPGCLQKAEISAIAFNCMRCCRQYNWPFKVCYNILTALYIFVYFDSVYDNPGQGIKSLFPDHESYLATTSVRFAAFSSTRSSSSRLSSTHSVGDDSEADIPDRFHEGSYFFPFFILSATILQH